MSFVTIKTALLSVSDKTGIIPFAKALEALGIRLISTGGTASLLQKEGIAVTEVADITGFPEIMDGRVKTLHPKIHGGILARRDLDVQVMKEHHISAIDLVVVNLYPFSETIAKPNCTLADAIENIDVGGPTMIRASAKNHAWVTTLVDPNDYDALLLELQTHQNQASQTLRKSLALKAFTHTAAYDTAIAHYLNQEYNAKAFPQDLCLHFHKKQTLRYGENPHQQASFYIDPAYTGPGLAHATQHQGIELSYNNIADSDAALACVAQFTEQPACVIVKHANPCGVALGTTLLDAYQKAYAGDPSSAFGGIIAFNRPLDEETVHTILAQQFVEVLLAPSFTPEALATAKKKPNIRLISTQDLSNLQMGWQYKQVHGGLLVQTEDKSPITLDDCRVVTDRIPTEQEKQDAWFVWQVCHFVKSNAIVFGRAGQTFGIGAGQMSRVMSTRIARWQAEQMGFHLPGCAMASDAFFPFRDSIDTAAEAGIRCIIQPGGSKRDAEVIAAANEHDIAMLFTGIRHFKH